MKFLLRFLRVVIGSIVFALGTVIIMDSNIGYGPWDVFHAGLAIKTSMSIGQASIVVGCSLILINIIVKEAVGISTAGSMLMVGVLMDAFRLIPFRPIFDSSDIYIFRVAYMLLGLFVCALGTYSYISAGLGTGPRDGIMVSLRRHTGIPVGVSRIILEISAAIIGWLMGGPIGLGTILYAFGLGIAIQIVFNLFRFEPTKLKHDSFKDNYYQLKAFLTKKNESIH